MSGGGASESDEADERCEPRLTGLKTRLGELEDLEDDVELSAYLATGACI